MSVEAVARGAYEEPFVAHLDELVFEENEVPVFAAAIGWVLLVFGSAYAWCQAMCGWQNVDSCETGWLEVKAVCKK